MNRHEAVTLLQLARGAKIVSVHYDDATTTRDYHYKLIGFTVKPDDTVVVPTVNGVKLAKVVKVFDTLPSNVPDGTKLKYIISRVDLTVHDRLEAEEEQLVSRLAAAELHERMAKFAAATGVDLMALPTPAMDAAIRDALVHGTGVTLGTKYVPHGEFYSTRKAEPTREFASLPCNRCDGTGWVDEANPSNPWGGISGRADATEDGPGMPCRLCIGEGTVHLDPADDARKAMDDLPV